MRDEEKMSASSVSGVFTDRSMSDRGSFTEKVGAIKRVASTAPLATSLAPMSGADSIIGARTRIRGTLQFSGRAIVDGTVDGEVIVEGELIVGENGAITGNVTADKVRVAGKIRGDIHGHERVELMPSAVVNGDLHCTRIVIQDGASFEGSCFMGSADSLRDELEKEGSPQETI